MSRRNSEPVFYKYDKKSNKVTGAFNMQGGSVEYKIKPQELFSMLKMSGGTAMISPKGDSVLVYPHFQSLAEMQGKPTLETTTIPANVTPTGMLKLLNSQDLDDDDTY